MKKSGQATVEFVFSFSLLLFFFLFFITVGINLSVGYVVHYAVFKTSRFYLTYDNGGSRFNVIAEAQNRSYSVFSEFAKSLNLSGVLDFNPPGAEIIYEYVGAKYLYSPNIKKIGPFALEDDFKFLSESFLGKEPSRDECRCRTQLSLGEACDGTIDIDATVFDNGC